jgi:GNAT superfamily N-acetyltransferase
VVGSTAHEFAHVVELNYHDDRVIADFYQRILLPHFDADELETKKSITEGLRESRTVALVMRAQDGTIAGGAVCDWFPKSHVLLFSYIAVPVEYRERGIGTQLLLAVRGAWADKLGPRLIVGEVEDPRCYHDTTFGDPAKRVRLYERNGARSLPVPYFQPALRPGRQRVPHLLLMVFGGAEAPPGTLRVDGERIERFLGEYFELCEGPPHADDAEYQRMLAACRRPGGLPMLLVSELPPVDAADQPAASPPQPLNAPSPPVSAAPPTLGG